MDVFQIGISVNFTEVNWQPEKVGRSTGPQTKSMMMMMMMMMLQVLKVGIENPVAKTCNCANVYKILNWLEVDMCPEATTLLRPWFPF